MSGPTPAEIAARELAAKCNFYDYNVPRNGPGSQGTIPNCSVPCSMTMEGGTGRPDPAFRYKSHPIAACGYHARSLGAGCREQCPANSILPVNQVCGSPNNKHRLICERDISSFKPIKDGNVREQCCTLPLTNMEERNRRDCPQAFHRMADGKSSPACSDNLLARCVTERKKPDDIVQSGCDGLNTGDPATRDTYNNAMAEYCMTDLKHLANEQCAIWCNSNPTVCVRTRVTDLCKTMGPEDFGTYQKVCGCFLNHSIYDKIKKELSRTYRIPESMFNGGRKCYFPGCNDATIKEFPDNACPQMNLINCIQNINVDNTNGNIDRVEIKANQNCGREFPPNENCNPKCQPDEECTKKGTEDVCEPNACKEKGNDCDYKTEQCNGGMCVPRTGNGPSGGGGPPKKGLSKGAIAGIVVGVLVLLGAIVAFMMMRKPSTAPLG